MYYKVMAIAVDFQGLISVWLYIPLTIKVISEYWN